jgi:hypothetical protein
MKLVKLSILCSLVAAVAANASVITFTGDVPADFATYDTETATDPLGDVSMPYNAPAGATSGWDLAEVVFFLSVESDILQIGLDGSGIIGDVDGNGIDGNSAQWLLDNGGVDYWNLLNSESAGIAFDFNMDGTYDIIAGVSGYSNVHQVCEFNGFPALPFMAFGNELPYYDGGRFYNPVVSSPDYELSIINIQDFLIWDGDFTCFNFMAFGGSFEDDGVGEEYVIGEMCLEDETLTAVVLPEEFKLNVYPNPFNPTTQLEFDLVEPGSVNLGVYNLSGQLVQTLLQGDLAAGTHNVVFNATDLASGIYIARLQTENASKATRIVLLK